MNEKDMPLLTDKKICEIFCEKSGCSVFTCQTFDQAKICVQTQHDADLQVLTQNWQSKPTKGGMYWKSAFCDGHYISPRVERIIDYDRPERGLEVEQNHGDSIPLDVYLTEHYPKSLWQFIPEPTLPQNKP